MKEVITAELREHATDEFRDVDMIANRILQLGGMPVTQPENRYEMTNCGYEASEDPNVLALLKQNIKGEQCAISVYKKMMEVTKDADPVTHNMALEILQNEVKHEEALEEDIGPILKRG